MKKVGIPPLVSAGLSLLVGVLAVVASGYRSFYSVGLWAAALAVYARNRTVSAAAGAGAIAVAVAASPPRTEAVVVGGAGAALVIAALTPLTQPVPPTGASAGSVARPWERSSPVALARRASETAAARHLTGMTRRISRERWLAASSALQVLTAGMALWRPALLGSAAGSLLVTALAAACDVRAVAVAVAVGAFVAALLITVGERVAGEALGLLPFLTLAGLLVRVTASGFIVPGARDRLPEAGLWSAVLGARADDVGRRAAAREKGSG